MSSNRDHISTDESRTGRSLRRRLAIVVVAMLACASCRHGHATHASTPDAGAPSFTDASEPLAASRTCPADAASCDEPQCQSDADCAPTSCQRAVCLDARCSYAPVPPGSACGAGLVCSQSGNCGDCVPGTQRCQPGSASLLETCSEDGHWRAMRCEGQACFNGQCTGECEPASTLCEGALLRTCGVDGRFGPGAACAEGSCTAGSCLPGCLAGATRCLDAGRMQSCDATGWGPIRDCGALPCIPERGGCGPVCTPGDVQCVDARSQQTCTVDGQWQAAVACELGCESQRCLHCTAGELRCTPTALEVCAADGSWQQQEACSAGCQASRCNACEPATAVCPEPADSTRIRLCRADGSWKAVESCRPHAHCAGGHGDTCPCDPGYHASGLDGDPAAGSCVLD